LFFLRKPKNYKSGPLPIYLKQTVNGSPKELSAKRKCLPADWNAASGRVNGKKESARELNQYLDSLEQKVYQAKRKLIDNDQEITVDAIKDILIGADEHKVMILDVFSDHNKQMKALEGIEYAGNTIIRYETTMNHVRSFIKWKYLLDDLDIKKLDYEFIEQFCFWFKSVQKCNHNSTMKYLSNFKKIVLTCVKKRQLAADPFSEFKFSKKPVEKIALTDDELKKISKKEFSSDRLDHVRDIFLFSCYTGLSYADVEKLKRSEIVKGMDNELWIFTHRQKPIALQGCRYYQKRKPF
jgi:hypothetical protein